MKLKASMAWPGMANAVNPAPATEPAVPRSLAKRPPFLANAPGVDLTNAPPLVGAGFVPFKVGPCVTARK